MSELFEYEMTTEQMRFHADTAKELEEMLRGDGRIPIRHELLIKYADEFDTLRASNAKLRDALENAKDKLQNTLDLARTGLAPTPLGLTEEQWLQHKCYRIGSELSRVLEIAEEALTNGN